MNPFQSILSSLGMGGSQDATAGPNPGPTPAQQPGFPGVNPPRFAGERTGIMGAFDNLSGAPTQSEWQAGTQQQKLQIDQEADRALQELTPEINRIREANPGAQPHEIMRQVIGSPGFAKTAMKVPGERMMKFVQDITAATQAPAPQPWQQGTQYGSRDPVTQRVTVQGSVPTAQMQNYEYMRKLTPEERQSLTMIDTKPPSDKEAAVANLVRMGKITYEDGQKIIAGVLRMEPIRDEFGAVQSYGVFDMSNPGKGGTILPPATPDSTADAAAAAGTPGAPTPAQRQAQAAPNAPAQITARQQAANQAVDPSDIYAAKPDNDFQDPAEIYGYASPQAVLSGKVGTLTQNIPGMQGAGERINQARTRINNIAAAGAKITAASRFKSEHERFNKILPSGDNFAQNPVDEVNSAIERRRLVSRWMASDRATIADPAQSRAAKTEASKRIGEYQGYLSQEAPMANLMAFREKLRGGEGTPGADELTAVVPGGDKMSGVVGKAADAVTKRGTQTVNPYSKMTEEQLLAEGAKPLDAGKKAQLLEAIRALRAAQPKPPVGR